MDNFNFWKKIWNKKGNEKTCDLKHIDGFERDDIDFKKIYNNISQIIKLRKSDKVLEVGCGAGALGKFFIPNCQYRGCDYSENMVNKHKELVGKNVDVCEAGDLPYDDNFFDKVFAFSIFQYFPNKEYAEESIAEMVRVSRFSLFLGDLAFDSIDKNHFLIDKKYFNGWELSNGFHNKNRFIIN